MMTDRKLDEFFYLNVNLVLKALLAVRQQDNKIFIHHAKVVAI